MRSSLARRSSDGHRPAQLVGQVVGAGAAAEALPVDHHHVVVAEEQVLDPVVLVQQCPRTSAERRHQRPVAGRDPVADGDRTFGQPVGELGLEALPQVRPHAGQGMDALVDHARDPLELGRLDLAPPARVEVGQGQRGPLGLRHGHALDLVGHGEVAEVLHHHHEVGGAADDVGEVRLRRAGERATGQLVVEADLGLVHAEAHALGAVGLVGGGQLHHHAGRRAPLGDVVGQGHLEQLTHDADTGADLLDGRLGDLGLVDRSGVAEHVGEPGCRDVVGGRGDRRLRGHGGAG